MFNKLFAILSYSFAFCAASMAIAAPNFSATLVPENDLWKQDKLESATIMTEELFNRIIAAAQETYAPIASANNETLTIIPKWTNANVNARCVRFSSKVEVYVYGGLARRTEVTPDGLALALCHELGHAYAGAPYLFDTSFISAEGLSDYYAANTCLEKVLQKLQDYPEQLIKTAYTQKLCTEKFGTDAASVNTCLRELSAGQSLGNLFSVLMETKVTNYETPDKTVVKETLISYPTTSQCRLDTYLNGIFGLVRPACWFKS